jgi:hypothetical protein
MRSTILRALAFGAVGGVALLAFNVALALFRVAPNSSSWSRFAQAQFFLGCVSFGVLFVGALIGFAAVRKNIVSVREAMFLGALSAIPAAATSAFAMELGLAGAVAAAMAVATLISFVGGGGLRSKAGLRSALSQPPRNSTARPPDV